MCKAPSYFSLIRLPCHSKISLPSIYLRLCDSPALKPQSLLIASRMKSASVAEPPLESLTSLPSIISYHLPPHLLGYQNHHVVLPVNIQGFPPPYLCSFHYLLLEDVTALPLPAASLVTHVSLDFHILPVL